MGDRVNYKINQEIKSGRVRLVDREGKQLGVVETAKALEKARKAGLDLVEVAPAAKPPVARLLNFRQFLLEKKKQEKKSKKKVTRSEVKEIRIRPNIGEADLSIRAKRTKEFLEEGHRVKLTVVFRGREITHPEIGIEKINKLLGLLAGEGKTMGKPRRKGRTIEVILLSQKRKANVREDDNA
jgi:translation initiation factor IF-3